MLLNLWHKNKNRPPPDEVFHPANHMRLTNSWHGKDDSDFGLSVRLSQPGNARNGFIQVVACRLVYGRYIQHGIERIGIRETVILEGVRQRQAVHVAPQDKRSYSLRQECCHSIAVLLRSP